MVLASKPIAVKKMVRGADGIMKVVFIDPTTGQQIPQEQLGAYQIIDQGSNQQDLQSLGLDPVRDQPPQEQETTAENIIDTTPENANNSFSKNVINKAKDVTSEKERYGYKDKPGIVGLAAAFHPAGKAVNTAMNVGNMSAIGKARDVAGLDDTRNLLDKGKALLGNQNSYVGDAKIGDKQYSVGLDALDPAGRTTLTPEEARKRGELAGGLETATRDETKSAIKTFRDNNDIETKGLIPQTIGRTKDAIEGFFSNIFGSSTEAAESPSPYVGKDYYPAAPNAPVEDTEYYANTKEEETYSNSDAPEEYTEYYANTKEEETYSNDSQDSPQETIASSGVAGLF